MTRLLAFPVILFAVLFALTLATVSLPRAAPDADPLMTLDTIHPGAAWSALAGFDCYSTALPDVYNFCMRAGSGLVRSVYVTLDGSVVQAVTYSLDGMHIAALESHLGRATSRGGSARYVNLCYAGHARAVVVTRPFANLHVSTSLSLSSSDLC